MTSYNELKKIIPPDQALANQALSRSLRQVKEIFNTDLPSLAQAVSVLESNKDLPLINDLTTPIPPQAQQFISTTLATGSGPGNTVTISDLIGTAAGVTINEQLPVMTNVVSTLSNIGALDSLTGNGGTPTSVNNGVYTVMSYCLAGVYNNYDMGGNLIDTTIPAGLPGAGTYANENEAFGNGLIPAASNAISSIASAYADLAAQANDAANAMGQQLNLNVINCTAAGIDIGNVVNDLGNANLIANSVSTSLGLASRLHGIGTDITANGTAQFFEAVADTSNLTGQAVIASMREGRNIAVLNAVGIQLDTQLIDLNENTTVSNNISNAQYSVTEARANIVI